MTAFLTLLFALVANGPFETVTEACDATDSRLVRLGCDRFEEFLTEPTGPVGGDDDAGTGDRDTDLGISNGF